ncbi:EAL domain-containing protein [Thiomicrorhabdus sp.]|uniref:bifunctional diguanylate cyclase/phosphodiesterase n=1 Tax=Thiomicrorhabdus sp. TaxID=2039724 RepID=UPI0029C826D3|nr:EAL domain-containing protein [Thiomicrorhabdus sp.]
MLSRSFPKVDDVKSYFSWLRHLPVAVVVVETESRKIRFANYEAERLFGFSEETLLNRLQPSLHPDEENQKKDAFAEHFRMLKEFGRIEKMASRILCSGDRILDVEITANIVYLNEVEAQVGVFVPVEGKAEAYRELEKIEHQFEAVFLNSHTGILLCDQQGFILKANPRLLEILGYTDSLRHKSMSILFERLSDFHEFELVSQGLLEQGERVHYECRLAKKDGDPVWVNLCGKPVDPRVPPELPQGVLWVIDDINFLKKTEHELKIQQELFSDGPAVLFHWRPKNGWPISYVSGNIQQVLGYDPEKLLKENMQFVSLLHPNESLLIQNEVKHYLDQKVQRFEQSYRLKAADGEYRQFYAYTKVDYDGEHIRAVWGYLIDMTEFLKAQELSELLLSHTHEGIFGIDNNGMTTFINPAGAQMLGYEPEELIGGFNHALIHHSDPQGHVIHDSECKMMLPIKTGESQLVSNEVLWRKDGSYFDVEYKSSPLYRKNQIIGAVVTFSDISQRRLQEAQIHHMAFHDELTGLPNRRLFNDRLAQILKRDDSRQHGATLMIMDLDHFKEVNDTLGHPTGDKLLQEISKRISRVIRKSDTLARLGGDEFSLLVEYDFDVFETYQVVERILALFKKPFEIDGHLVQSNTCIGIAFCDTEMAPEQIISQADIALYRAKSMGQGSYVFYEESMSSKVKEDVVIVAELSRALNREEFELYYQPQIAAATREIVGLEVLLRWFPANPLLQPVSSPGKFIPVAESRGLIFDITMWQIQVISEDLKRLRALGFKGKISINISGELLRRIEMFIDLIENIDKKKLSYSDLQFEITETIYAELTHIESDVLRTLQKNGLDFSIDDFGTGYSSLALLRKFQSGSLKIDKEFIDEVDCNDDDHAIVSATISMAHKLGKKVVAEGVEKESQLAVLQEMECDVIQGYLFARPMNIEDTCKFIKNY